MTELEAVNMLLAVIGEAPIDKLADSSKNEITDASLARKTLSEVKRDVCSEGWSWNTDFAVKLTPDSKKQFLLDENVAEGGVCSSSVPHSRTWLQGD